MSDKIYNVLFLCAANSARSVMAECALRRWGPGRFQGFSAGSRPAGVINPLTLRLLQSYNYKVDGLRSKSWDEFLAPDAPRMDFVFTVCEETQASQCPVFPGSPMSAFWPIEDPVVVEGTEEKRLKAFRRAYIEIESRVKYFAALRLEGLDKLALQAKLSAIGAIEEAASAVA